MEGLTREERDRLVEERMQIMKKKNEAARKRHEEIEAEKLSLGAAAAPPSAGGSSGWRAPEYKEDWQPRDTEDERFTPNSGSGWPGENPEERTAHSWDSNTPHRERGGQRSRGSRQGYRGGRGGTPRHHNQSSQSNDGGFGGARSPPVQTHDDIDWTQSTPSPANREASRGSSGSGRLSGRTNRHIEQSYDEIRKQNAHAYEQDLKNQTISGGNNFLNDNFRSNSSNFERTNQDARGGQYDSRGGGAPSRHPRNFGGGDQMDLREKIKRDRQRKSGGSQNFNADVDLTGRERHEHNKWKTQQDQYDKERIERAKSHHGDWKREWDVEKRTSDDSHELPVEYGIYKDMDSKKMSSHESPSMRGVASIKGSVPGKGRGRGRGQRPAKPTQDSNTQEQHRKVERDTEELKITVNNSQFSNAGQPRQHVNEPRSPPHNAPHSPNKDHPPRRQSAGGNRYSQHNAPQSPTKPNHSHAPQSPNYPNAPPSPTKPNYPRNQTPGRQNSGGPRHNQTTRYSESRDERQYQEEYQRSGGPRRGGRGGGGGRGGRGGGRRGQQFGEGGSSFPVEAASTTPAKSTVTTDKSPSQAAKSGGKAKSTPEPSKSAAPTPARVNLNVSTSSEEQEIIVADDEDEDGWVDCDTDEEFYEEAEEVTPHASKEPTPALSDKSISKEGTPVPQSQPAAERAASKEKPSTEAAVKGEPKAAEVKGEGEKTPVKPHLHIDIRDSVNEDGEVEDGEVEDVLKTPEGGREHLDWAAEMEAASPITTPALKLTNN